jgi:hypothetical protein
MHIYILLPYRISLVIIPDFLYIVASWRAGSLGVVVIF